jgi:hypothetical protein
MLYACKRLYSIIVSRGFEKRLRCTECGHDINATLVRTLSSHKKREFVPAEDGDWPGEITVDHFVNVYTGRRLFRIPEHKKGLLKGRCPASGRTFAKGFRRVGRPYVLRYVRRSRTK